MTTVTYTLFQDRLVLINTHTRAVQCFTVWVFLLRLVLLELYPSYITVNFL